MKFQAEIQQLRQQLSTGAAVTGRDDNELKVVEITDKPDSQPAVTSAVPTSENLTSYPRDFMKRYEALLDENRVMRKLLDDLGCKDTDGGADAGAGGAGAGEVVMV